MQKDQEQRVQKLLSNYGYCSRRKAEDLIKQGRVKVNSRIITLGDKAFEKDKISVDEKTVKKEEKAYILLNKPVGCICAVKDKYDKTVLDIVKVKERVFPVGRLDKMTSGLLILTNDGDYANKIAHPSNEIKKTYVAELDRYFEEKDIKALEKGIYLSDGKTSPAKVDVLGKGKIRITIHEGRNKIIRRMMKKLGYKVKSLKRTRVGGLSLGNLKKGRFTFLGEEDRQKVFSG